MEPNIQIKIVQMAIENGEALGELVCFDMGKRQNKHKELQKHGSAFIRGN